jgi:BASS family bile acid:Na+ symporter
VNAATLLSDLFNAAIAVSILATVLSLGMSLSPGQLLAPLRRTWLVVGMIGLNALVMPAVAWGLFTALGLSEAAVVGLALTTAGAAGAVGLKASQMSKRADLPLAVSLVIVLQLVNVVAVPVWAGRVVSGATIRPGQILESLVLLVVAPLVVGLALRGRYPQPAADWQPALVRVSSLALGIAIVAGLSANWSTIVSLLGSRVMLAAVLVPLIGLVAGSVLGGRDPGTRTTTGIVSGVRFTSLGLIIIGTQLDGNPDYLGPALVLALADLVVAVLVSLEIGRRAARTTVRDG